MRKIAALGLTALLGLAACQPQAPGGGEAPAPADAPATAAPVVAGPAAAFEGDLNLLGNEPFWSLQIRDKAMTLTRPDQPDVVVGNPGVRMDGEQGVWDALTPTARLYVTLQAKPCTDGMSGMVYPFTAQVQAGDATLAGCAAKADAMPRETP